MNGPVTPTMVRKSSTLGASASSDDRASDNHPPSNDTNTVSNTAFFTMDSLLCELGRGVAGKALLLHIESYRLSTALAVMTARFQQNLTSTRQLLDKLALIGRTTVVPFYNPALMLGGRTSE